jgi:hypothetical protein
MHPTTPEVTACMDATGDVGRESANPGARSLSPEMSAS